MGICLGTSKQSIVMPAIVTHHVPADPEEEAHIMPHTEVPTTCAVDGTITWQQLEQTLRRYPTLIERYVLNNVSTDVLKEWLYTKQPNEDADSDRGDHFNEKLESVQIDHSQLLELLSRPVAATTDPMTDQQQSICNRQLLVELCSVLARVVGRPATSEYSTTASCHRVYTVLDESQPKTLQMCDPSGNPVSSILQRPLTSGHVMAGHAAHTCQQVQCQRPFVDQQNFAEGIDDPPEGLEYALCQPIVLHDQQVVAVLELFASAPFSDVECSTLNSFAAMVAVSLRQSRQYRTLENVRRVHDFVFNVTKSIFQDMVSMDTLIVKIMNFARKLVSADRASLFLVDSKTKELYSRIFDMGNTSGDASPNVKEIRIEVGSGIAGEVAFTGEGLNITDAYSDERFNRSVDHQTGYITRSLLCMPIFNRGSVIGVMQMVNKTGGTVFTKEDEKNFEFFAVYCGLALYHAKLYEKIRRSEKKYKVALEVLSYHNSCTEEEMSEYKNATQNEPPSPQLSSYDYNVFLTDEATKVKDAVHMFLDLFGSEQFDIDSLVRFTLTVRKNYRRVSYHNWTHGFSVANMMYCILVHNPGVFNFIEAVSMYVGSLCHDLDHRGRNNRFMLEIDSPLAAIYTTSTMEHHHFNQTVTILQQEGHNILRQFSSAEYKSCLGNIKHCVLATDLAMFFPNQTKLSSFLNKGSYDWKNSEHRLLLQAIAMTACDLCASSKPWKVHIQTVADIFEEFYDQGDEEKRAGRVPLQLMDRKQHDQQAHSQVGFLGSICIPCYDVLQQLIPETNSLLVGCKENMNQWLQMTETGEWQQELISSSSIRNTIHSGDATKTSADRTLSVGTNLPTELALEAAGISSAELSSATAPSQPMVQFHKREPVIVNTKTSEVGEEQEVGEQEVREPKLSTINSCSIESVE